jgi:hypothetical protein
MAQYPFTKSDHADVDRAHDWWPAVLFQNKLRASSAEVQRQYSGYSGRQTGPDTQHGPLRLFLTGDHLHLEPGFPFNSIQKFLSVSGVAHGTGRHGGDGIGMTILYHLPPFLQSCNHPLHRISPQHMIVINPLTEPKDAPV